MIMNRYISPFPFATCLLKFHFTKDNKKMSKSSPTNSGDYNSPYYDINYQSFFLSYGIYLYMNV